MARSGQDLTAAVACDSNSAGTSSGIAEEWPSMSSSSKSCGAFMAQSVWPWQRSWSTLTFTVSPVRLLVEVVPLEVTAGVDPHLRAGHVARLVRGEEQDRVADVEDIDVADRHGLLHGEDRLGVLTGRVLQVRTERPVHRLAHEHRGVDV